MTEPAHTDNRIVWAAIIAGLVGVVLLAAVIFAGQT